MEDQIISFFSWIEKEVQRMEYGTLTCVIMVSKGLPVAKTANLTGQKRKRYKNEQSLDTSANK